MHDSDNYGILRWTLKEISQAVGCTLKDLSGLVCKEVIKGCDAGVIDNFIYAPRSARKVGDAVILIEKQNAPIWYSSRMVTDEYVRSVRGQLTRFDSPKVPIGEGMGEGIGAASKPVKSDGSTASSTSTSKNKRHIPENFVASERVKVWAEGKGHLNLDKHLESFIGAAKTHGYRYVDWDEAFMKAIRDNWAKLPSPLEKNKPLMLVL